MVYTSKTAGISRYRCDNRIRLGVVKRWNKRIDGHILGNDRRCTDTRKNEHKNN